MSKLIDTVQLFEVGSFQTLPDERPIDIQVKGTKCLVDPYDYPTITRPSDPYGYTEYQLTASVTCTGHLSNREAQRSNIDFEAYLTDQMKRGIIEEVFGEFRPHLRRLRELIYALPPSWDGVAVTEVLDEIREIENRMFGH